MLGDLLVEIIIAGFRVGEREAAAYCGVAAWVSSSPFANQRGVGPAHQKQAGEEQEGNLDCDFLSIHDDSVVS